MTYVAPPIPKAFIARRAHSLAGIWLVLYLIEHLLTNSQAALFFGDSGKGFVSAVNSIKSLPFLPAIEVFLVGLPLAIHAIWGVKYIFTAKMNSFASDGSTPSLPQYPLNKAYSWQRITSWILLFGIIAHVVHMRFLEYPASTVMGTDTFYMVRVSKDDGLYPLTKRLGFELYTQQDISNILSKNEKTAPSQSEESKVTPSYLIEQQSILDKDRWIKTLNQFSLDDNHLLAISKTFGLAELLMVRNTFKSPLMILLYTGLVITACFHGFNGLWTFMIRWGVTLSAYSQQLMRKFAIFLMVLIACLGLSAIWGSYFLNFSI